MTIGLLQDMSSPNVTVGYLVPWGAAAAALTVDAVEQGIRVHNVGNAPTTYNLATN